MCHPFILGAGTPWFCSAPSGMEHGHALCSLRPLAGLQTGCSSFPDSPKFPQTLPHNRPWLRFPSSPLVLLCSGEGRVAENFRSTHSLQPPSQSCPIPPHPCLASSRYSQRDKMKNRQISHGAGAGMQQRRALLGTGCSSS